MAEQVRRVLMGDLALILDALALKLLSGERGTRSRMDRTALTQIWADLIDSLKSLNMRKILDFD